MDDPKHLDFSIGIGQGRVLRVQPQYTQAQCLLGWLCLGDTHIRHRVESDIPSVDWKTADKSLVHFAEVLSKGSNAEALMGRAFYHELKENYTEALADLSQVLFGMIMQESSIDAGSLHMITRNFSES